MIKQYLVFLIILISCNYYLGCNLSNNGYFKYNNLALNVNNEPVVNIQNVIYFSDSQYIAELTLNPWCTVTSMPVKDKVVFLCDFKIIRGIIKYYGNRYYFYHWKGDKIIKFVLFDFNKGLTSKKYTLEKFTSSYLESKIVCDNDTIYKFRLRNLGENTEDIVFFVSKSNFITGMYVSTQKNLSNYSIEGPIFEKVGKVFYNPLDSIRNDSLISITQAFDIL